MNCQNLLRNLWESNVRYSFQVAAQNNESTVKRSKQDGAAENSKEKTEQNGNATPKDYIHVRARRGQATDSHSLAERVRNLKALICSYSLHGD